jgi:predicted KAP-like P-loop ATPase
MSVPNPSGFDAAPAQRDQDNLDRWRFAAEIVEVALAIPPEWSARIGIFGRWGEDKSAVLRFREQMLKEKGNIFFSFSPWAIQNWNDLWEEFGNRLLEALSTANIPFDGSWKKLAKDSGKWLESKGVDQIVEMEVALFGKEKAYNGAFGVLSRWLKYDGFQIRAIREKLGDRRLVILIDDLDRCSSELIPQLFLSLRELLDLPGFTFLLAFDDEIVGRALAEENSAWVVGSNFLEKMLDFRFHLPPITEPQKGRFIFKAIARYCPFVPKKSMKEIQGLLPNNPRKLKALIRSLSALQPQIPYYGATRRGFAVIPESNIGRQLHVN